jgi:hypothetical protein
LRRVVERSIEAGARVGQTDSSRIARRAAKWQLQLIGNRGEVDDIPVIIKHRLEPVLNLSLLAARVDEVSIDAEPRKRAGKKGQLAFDRRFETPNLCWIGVIYRVNILDEDIVRQVVEERMIGQLVVAEDIGPDKLVRLDEIVDALVKGAEFDDADTSVIPFRTDVEIMGPCWLETRIP